MLPYIAYMDPRGYDYFKKSEKEDRKRCFFTLKNSGSDLSFLSFFGYLSIWEKSSVSHLENWGSDMIFHHARIEWGWNGRCQEILRLILSTIPPIRVCCAWNETNSYGLPRIIPMCTQLLKYAQKRGCFCKTTFCKPTFLLWINHMKIAGKAASPKIESIASFIKYFHLPTIPHYWNL